MSCASTRNGAASIIKTAGNSNFGKRTKNAELKQTQIEERDKQLAQIDKELPAVLRELLGINYEREMNKYFVDTDEDNRRLAFLSDDKRGAAAGLARPVRRQARVRQHTI